MSTWYVYQLTFSDGAFYIGYRGTVCEIGDDFMVKYFSSSNAVKRRILNGEICCGEILYTSDSQSDAYDVEQRTIYDNFTNPCILNQTCYFGRDGFGILSAESRQKISARHREMWADPAERAKRIEAQKRGWTAERRQKQSADRTGVPRPDHSAWMLQQPINQAFVDYAKRPRPESHKLAISESLKGKPKPLVVCRLYDKKPMALGNFMNWCRQQDQRVTSDAANKR